MPSDKTIVRDSLKKWTGLSKQLAQAQTLLRKMRATVEDIEGARTIERAKRTNGNKPHIPWSQVKKLQLD